MNTGKIYAGQLWSPSGKTHEPENLHSAAPSLMFLKPERRVSVADLNTRYQPAVGNDACVAMAEFVAGDRDTFVGQMNQYGAAWSEKYPL